MIFVERFSFLSRRVPARTATSLATFSRGAVSQIRGGIVSFTGKDDYELVDLTRTAVSKFTGKESYQFGDISNAAVSNVKDAVTKITGKDECEFGDLTKVGGASPSRCCACLGEAVGPRSERSSAVQMGTRRSPAA
mmetsp:Transcript_290/g.1218  ORF Transcript_290/g.1218 Transcript_290/m.1218 type:complete len:136 (-) Transcript_290:69-476(-)